MLVDEVTMLLEELAAHRSMVLEAAATNPQVDVVTALQVHAGLGNLLARWSEFSVRQHREIVRTVEYLINPDDEDPDLASPHGFDDDLAELRRLQLMLG